MPFSALVLELESRVRAAVPVWSTHTGNLSRSDPSSSLQQEQAETAWAGAFGSLKEEGLFKELTNVLPPSSALVAFDGFAQSSRCEGAQRTQALKNHQGPAQAAAPGVPLPHPQSRLLSRGSPSPQQGWSLLQPLMD